MEPEIKLATLNDAIMRLCQKAREDAAPPFKISIKDSAGAELWSEETTLNADKFSWTHPDLTYDHILRFETTEELGIEITAANGFTLSERLIFNEAPEQLMEAAAD